MDMVFHINFVFQMCGSNLGDVYLLPRTDSLPLPPRLFRLVDCMSLPNFLTGLRMLRITMVPRVVLPLPLYIYFCAELG